MREHEKIHKKIIKGFVIGPLSLGSGSLARNDNKESKKQMHGKNDRQRK